MGRNEDIPGRWIQREFICTLTGQCQRDAGSQRRLKEPCSRVPGRPLSHVAAGWFGACCSVNPLRTCQTSVDVETLARARGHSEMEEGTRRARGQTSVR